MPKIKPNLKILSVIMALLLTIIVYAQDEVDLTPPSDLGFAVEQFINDIPIIGNFIVPDEQVITDTEKINVANVERLVNLEQQADDGVITQEQLKASSDVIEAQEENNNLIIQQNINDIQSGNPTEDVSDAQAGVAEISSAEPIVTGNDLSEASDGAITSDFVKNNDMGVSEAGIEGGSISTDSGAITSTDSGVVTNSGSSEGGITTSSEGSSSVGESSSSGGGEGSSSGAGGDSGSSSSSGDGGSGSSGTSGGDSGGGGSGE